MGKNPQYYLKVVEPIHKLGYHYLGSGTGVVYDANDMMAAWREIVLWLIIRRRARTQSNFKAVGPMHKLWYRYLGSGTDAMVPMSPGTSFRAVVGIKQILKLSLQLN